MAHRPSHNPPQVPDVDVLFVDLDGTLFASDCTYESLAVAAGRQPATAVGALMVTWPQQGLAAMKQRLVDVAVPDPGELP